MRKGPIGDEKTFIVQQDQPSSPSKKVRTSFKNPDNKGLPSEFERCPVMSG